MAQTARDLGIKPSLVTLVYKSYWKFIRTTISNLSLESMSEDDFLTTTTNFSLPYIGKLHTSYQKVQKQNRKIKYLQEHVKVKDNKTTV